MKKDYAYKWLIVLSSLFFVFFSYWFGFSLSTTSYNSFLLAASKFENNQNFTHISIDGYNIDLSYDDAISTAKSLYGRPGKINPYLKTKNEYDFTLFDINFSSNICAASTYSDKKQMECLSLPLYDDNSSIASGPKNGAMYAAYIPSSIADSLVESGLFLSFSDVLEKNIVFSANTNASSHTFSVNNIYLDNYSPNWERKEDLVSNSFYSHFASWNKRIVFSYCPKLIKADNQVCLSVDIASGYGNLDFLAKTAISSVSQPLSLTVHKNNNETLCFANLSHESVTNSFGIMQSLLLIILITLLAFNLAILIFNRFLYNSKKLLLILLMSLLLILLFGEIIKTIMPSNVLLYSIFNSTGNVIIVFPIILMTFLVAHRRKYESTIESDFFYISI